MLYYRRGLGFITMTAKKLQIVLLPAAPVSPSAAVQRVEGWLARQPRRSVVCDRRARSSPRLSRRPSGHVRTCSADGTNLFHLVMLEGGGFVAMSADDATTAVMGFSESGEVPTAEGGNPIWAFLGADAARSRRMPHPRRLRNIRTSDETIATSAAVTSAKSATRAYATSQNPITAATALDDVRVPPLVKSKWNQQGIGKKTLYNYYTPNGWYCGCVATSLAQLMRFYGYPTNSIAQHTFTCYTYDRYGNMSDGFPLTMKGGVYNWAGMPLVPTTSITDTERESIGRICYDIGVAMRMAYGENGSGSFAAYSFEPLKEVFGFVNAQSYLLDDAYGSDWQSSTVNDWNELDKVVRDGILANLDAGHPVMLGIMSGSYEGHAILADGYGYANGTLYCHLNMGWSGSSDFWYALPDIPSDLYTFSSVTDISYNMFPDRTGELVTGRVLDPDGVPVDGAAVVASIAYKRTIRTQSATGRWITLEQDVTESATAITDAYGIYAIYTPTGATCTVTLVAAYGSMSSSTITATTTPSMSPTDIDFETGHYTVPSAGISIGNSWGNDLVLATSTSTQTRFAKDDVSVTAYQGEYDGFAHGVEVTSRIPGFTVKYRVPTGTTCSTESPTITDAGTMTVIFEISAPRYVTETRTATVTITKAANAWIHEPSIQGWTYGQAANEPYMGEARFGAATVAYSDVPREVGTYTATFIVGGNSNYEGLSMTVPFTITRATYDPYGPTIGLTTIKAGEYFKKTLAELGYDVPVDGTPYSVAAKGLPAGLELKSNAAVKDRKGRIVTPAKIEWWIEGVPTAALDYATTPAYLVITANGKTETQPLPINVLVQEVVELEDLALWQPMNEQGYLPGVGAGWSVSGLPTGLKYTAKLLTTKKKIGKKTIVTTNALPYSVYGKTTKAGLFTVTAKKKVSAYYETMKYRVLVTPKAVDTAVFGEELTNIVTMAYVPVDWDLTGDGRARSPSGPQSGTDGEQSNVDGGRLGEAALPSVAAVGGNVVRVTGLPAGVTFAAKDTYAYKNAKKKTGKYLKQTAQTIMGTPTKPGTYTVTFTKNVKIGRKTVAKTAQILWRVVANDMKPTLDLNSEGGVVAVGTVGVKYGDLLTFHTTEGATVKASGLPAGITLANLGDGRMGFTGFTAKAGTYLVTVTATLNGNSVTQRIALRVDGLPAWAKGTYNGIVGGTGGWFYESGELPAKGLATVTVGATGKISGKFQENGTNWTISAACYTGVVRYDGTSSPCQVDAADTQDTCPYQTFTCSNVQAKHSYKATEIVKGKKKTVTKTLTREFTFSVSAVPVSPDFPDTSIRGVVELKELGGSEATTLTYAGANLTDTVAEIKVWQNLWGSTYKTVGNRLFYTSKKVPYRTFTFKGTTDEGSAMRLTEAMTLSIKVTPVGAVTATMSFDTGRTKKDPKTKKTVKVFYTATCSTVVIPASTADATAFSGCAYLHFEPSPANGFPGYSHRIEDWW